MPTKRPISGFARMLPRELFNLQDGKKSIFRQLDFLSKPGVYILYRNDEPYYVGKAESRLRSRLKIHAKKPGTKYYNFWTHFSVFVIEDRALIHPFEQILIAAMPKAANGARPKFPKLKLPPAIEKSIYKTVHQPQQLIGRAAASGLN